MPCLTGYQGGITVSGSVSACIAHLDFCASEGRCVDPAHAHPVRAAEMIREHVENTTPPVVPLVDDHTAAV